MTRSHTRLRSVQEIAL